jgi:hypothetical protein
MGITRNDFAPGTEPVERGLSTRRPTNPVEGRIRYETDTDELVTYNGSTWNVAGIGNTSLPEGYSVVPFTPGVLTDQTATMTAAIDELPAAGGVVLIPAGTFYSEIQLQTYSGLTFRGAGAAATTIHALTTGDPIIYGSGTEIPGGYTFEDITFDLPVGPSAMAVYAWMHDVTFRRCRFINIANYGLTLVGSVNTVIEDCEFDDGGTATGNAVYASEAVRGLRWTRSKVRFMESGLNFDGTPHDQIDIDGGVFDGGWYLLRTRPGGYTNSGGTVTYSAAQVFDSAAAFGALPTPYDVNVRVLPVLESGSTGTTYTFDKVTDAAATFETALVHPGYIIRTANKWAVVSHVFSETELYVEEWFDTSTYRPTKWPAGNTAYTVHQVVIGTVISNTATSINATEWIDIHDGTRVTPAAGTLYEVLINHGEYSGIHAPSPDANPSTTGGIQNIRVYGGCRLTRTWNDQLSIFGRDARLMVDQTVMIDNGQDFGITCHGNQARIFCTAIHNGACNIYVAGVDARIDARASGAPWMNAQNTLWLGDIIIGGSRTRASGSVVIGSGPYARHGFVVTGPDTEGDTDAVDLSGTSAHGYSVGEYRLYPLSGSITNTVLRDVTGVISSASATGTVTCVSSSETQTTVGAAGGASALPATPTKYIKVTIDGTDYVFPAYAVS